MSTVHCGSSPNAHRKRNKIAWVREASCYLSESKTCALSAHVLWGINVCSSLNDFSNADVDQVLAAYKHAESLRWSRLQHTSQHPKETTSQVGGGMLGGDYASEKEMKISFWKFWCKRWIDSFSREQASRNCWSLWRPSTLHSILLDVRNWRAI